MDILKKIKELKIIPVATIDKESYSIPLGKALIEAGLPILEITFRTESATKSINNLTNYFKNLIVGAGTVLKVEQVKKALDAGALFIVTPGFNPKIVDYCVDQGIHIIPGVNTPTMVEWALDKGISVVKFFPASLSGGVQMLKALSGPYPEMRFIPTGGINQNTIIEYLKLSNVIACGGSWIVKEELISLGKFDEIKKLTEEAISLIRTEFG
ncbi:MAG: bifunctional 4-hydroxy-2-oxoglutarate aldolase/2-dehydro-3-deoxy-phosphogluconate aldolase [Candidatus Thorarchaeota archaeon]